MTKFKTAAVAALALATTLAIPASEAQARGWGLAAGLVGGAIVAGAIAANANANTVYVDGYRRCRFVRQYDQFGYYVGTARVCNYY
jgi:hypothetical protein